MRHVLPLGICLLLTACPPAAGPECTTPSDCGATSQGSCPSCPSIASRYCEGGECVDKPSATRSITMDLTTPRNVGMASIRYVFITQRSTKQIAQCQGQAGCTADVVTCDTVAAEGFGGPSQNVTHAGAVNTDTQNGMVTFFQDINLGTVPSEQLLLLIEGRTEVLGGGSTVAFICRAVNSSDTDITATLVAQ